MSQHQCHHQGDIRTALVLLQHDVRFLFVGHGNLKEINLLSSTLDVIDQTPELCLEFLRELFNRGRNSTSNEKAKWHNDYESKAWDLVLFRPEFRTQHAVLEFLVRNGLNPNQPIVGRNGQSSPLFLAITHKNTTAIRSLLRLGANANLVAANQTLRKANKMMNALTFARENGCNREIIDLLRQHTR